MKNRCSETQSGCSIMPKRNVIYSFFVLTLLFAFYFPYIISILHKQITQESLVSILSALRYTAYYLKIVCNWSQLFFKRNCFSSHCALISVLLLFWCRYQTCRRAASLYKWLFFFFRSSSRGMGTTVKRKVSVEGGVHGF